MKQGNKIVLVLGIIALSVGIFVLSGELSFRKNSVQTEGKVISTLGSTFDVRYFTAEGVEKTKRFTAKMNPNRAGDVKQIWYLPDKTGKARLSNGTDGGSTLIISGLFCLLLGVYPLFLKNRETPAST